MTEIQNRSLRVFLCHASQDKPVVREIYLSLLAEGWIEPWLDEEKLLPGQNWDIEIEKAVEASDIVLVFLSNNSVTKTGYIQRELKFVLEIALEKPEDTIFLIPIRLDDCQVPRRIRSWHYVDYFPDSQKEKALDRILGSLGGRGENLGLFTDSVNTNYKEDIVQLELNNSDLETLKLLALGRSNYEIASLIKIPETAVKYRIRGLLEKFGAKTRLELISIARRKKIIQ